MAHIPNLDLNLLRVFAALLEEGSATRAGSRLGLSQSAVSHALGRLRLALGDELFVRGPAGLRPTPRAAEMGEAIRAALTLLETAVSAPSFDSSTAQRVFHLATSAYVGSVLIPAVAQRLLTEAPGIRLRVRPISPAVAEELDRGRLDMAIDSLEQVAARFVYRPLFTDTGVWVVRAHHPAGPRLTLETLATLPHLAVASGDPDEGRPGGAGASGLGLKRATAWSETYALGDRSMRDFDGPVSVPDSHTALAMISQTDMAALLPRRLATLYRQRGRLILIEPDGHPEPAEFGAAVRRSDAESGPVAWLLTLIAEVAAGI
ncbi:MAG: transcriptional regulator, LysR family [Caulobacter sp.]|nr:transcriptional regulator, LysR family [Caulobacter sp.]